jgi:hypothetical protein
MTLMDQIDGMEWGKAETDRFQELISGAIVPGIRTDAAQAIVLAAAAWIIASRAATPADLTRLHGEHYEVSARLRESYGVKAAHPTLRLVGGRDV